MATGPYYGFNSMEVIATIQTIEAMDLTSRYVFNSNDFMAKGLE